MSQFLCMQICYRYNEAIYNYGKITMLSNFKIIIATIKPCHSKNSCLFLNFLPYVVQMITCHTQSMNNKNTGDSCLCLVMAYADLLHLVLNGWPAWIHSLSMRASNLGWTNKHTVLVLKSCTVNIISLF